MEKCVGRRRLLQHAVVVGGAFFIGRSLGVFPFGEGAIRVASAAALAHSGDSEKCCLSPEDLEILDALAEVIIPGDALGIGAKQANVARRLDALLARQPDLYVRYVDGLRAIDSIARDRYKKSYSGMPFVQQTELFDYLMNIKDVVWTDSPPSGVVDRIVRRFKVIYFRQIVGVTDSAMILLDQLGRDVPRAFYATPDAWKGLGYSGPPFPFGYIGRQSVCSAQESRS